MGTFRNSIKFKEPGKLFFSFFGKRRAQFRDFEIIGLSGSKICWLWNSQAFSVGRNNSNKRYLVKVKFDTVIKNGMVVDGSGGPRFKADVGLKEWNNY